MELEPETMDLVVAIQAVVERLGEQFRRSGSTVTIQAPPSAVGRWDRLRIEQVIINLLSNAIKYGQGKPIAVTIEVDPARARLIVQDQGIGIPPDAIGRLFAPFERAVSSRHYSGLGLGLYIVHQIIEAHGGSIRVHSRLGSGSTFTVELPRQENARAD
jgi:signal transduction histidine kinase